MAGAGTPLLANPLVRMILDFRHTKKTSYKLTHRTVGPEFCTEQDFSVKIPRRSLFAHRYSEERASLVSLSEGGRAQIAALCADFHQEFPSLWGILVVAVVEIGFPAWFASPV